MKEKENIYNRHLLIEKYKYNVLKELINQLIDAIDSVAKVGLFTNTMTTNDKTKNKDEQRRIN